MWTSGMMLSGNGDSKIGKFWEEQGGYYIGSITDAFVPSYLILSPKATGEASTNLQLKSTNTATPGTQSLTDGLGNTSVMNDGQYPAAQFCIGLSINGFTDWYLPSIYELNVVYQNNGKLPTSESLNPLWYWASTESVSDSTMNWLQNFDDGLQYPDYKNLNSPVRAIRREPLLLPDPEGVSIGDAYEGGYYAGIIRTDTGCYWLVVSPKSSGENSSIQWKTTADSTSVTQSTNDGVSNTDYMIAAGSHPAATFCRSLSIGGFTDWYMPSKDELELLYYNFKPTTDSNITSSGTNPSSYPPRASNYSSSVPTQTGITAFKSGGSEAFGSYYYWASTEYGATYGWRQYFTNGGQGGDFKNVNYYVRAVRRLKIEFSELI